MRAPNSDPLRESPPAAGLGDFQPSRILLVRLSHLGDVCHALGVYHAIRAGFPGAQLWWALQPEFGDLVRDLPGLGGLLPFERRGGFSAWPKLRRQARALKFDLAVDAQGNWKSAFVTRFSGAKQRLGMAPKDWREPAASRLLNRFAEPAQGPHAMHRMNALAQALAPGKPLRWDLPLTLTERAHGRELLQAHLPSQASRPRRILHLGAPGDPRTWPSEHYAKLALSLAQAGESVLCLSGPSEAEAGRQLQAKLADQPHVQHLVGQKGLRAFAGLLAAAGEDQIRILCGDSGPSHVAAAVGQAVDLLAGPTDPSRTGPWPTGAKGPGLDGSGHRVLKAEHLQALNPDRVLAWLGY